MSEPQTCESCLYWKRWKSVSDHLKMATGECHRYPPSREKGRKPETSEDGWCGEWKKQDVTEELGKL